MSCQGVTLSGRPCKNKTCDDFCHLHSLYKPEFNWPSLYEIRIHVKKNQTLLELREILNILLHNKNFINITQNMRLLTMLTFELILANPKLNYLEPEWEKLIKVILLKISHFPFLDKYAKHFKNTLNTFNSGTRYC